MPAAPLTLSVQGWKSLRDEVRLDVRPLTLLAGRNSSGKSSFMQPFLLMKQTLEAPFDPGPLLLKGPNVDATPFESHLWASRAPGFHVEVVATEDDGEESRLTWRFSPGETGLPDVQEHSTPTFTIRNGDIIGHAQAADWILTRFLPRLVVEHGLDSDVTSEEFAAWVNHLVYVPGIRSIPLEAYSVTTSGHFAGLFDRYVPSILDHWQRTHDPALANVSADLQASG